MPTNILGGLLGARGGGGAGGGGIAFRTPRDTFNGANRAAAETLRDSTITDTTVFDDDPILGIILTWPGCRHQYYLPGPSRWSVGGR